MAAISIKGAIYTWGCGYYLKNYFNIFILYKDFMEDLVMEIAKIDTFPNKLLQ